MAISGKIDALPSRIDVARFEYNKRKLDEDLASGEIPNRQTYNVLLSELSDNISRKSGRVYLEPIDFIEDQKILSNSINKVNNEILTDLYGIYNEIDNLETIALTHFSIDESFRNDIHKRVNKLLDRIDGIKLLLNDKTSFTPTQIHYETFRDNSDIEPSLITNNSLYKDRYNNKYNDRPLKSLYKANINESIGDDLTLNVSLRENLLENANIKVTQRFGPEPVFSGRHNIDNAIDNNNKLFWREIVQNNSIIENIYKSNERYLSDNTEVYPNEQVFNGPIVEFEIKLQYEQHANSFHMSFHTLKPLTIHQIRYCQNDEGDYPLEYITEGDFVTSSHDSAQGLLEKLPSLPDRFYVEGEIERIIEVYESDEPSILLEVDYYRYYSDINKTLVVLTEEYSPSLSGPWLVAAIKDNMYIESGTEDGWRDLPGFIPGEYEDEISLKFDEISVKRVKIVMGQNNAIEKRIENDIESLVDKEIFDKLEGGEFDRDLLEDKIRYELNNILSPLVGDQSPDEVKLKSRYIDGYEYIYGINEIKLEYVEYQAESVWITKPIKLRNENQKIDMISIKASEVLPDYTDIEYYVNFEGYDEWIPLLEEGKTYVKNENINSYDQTKIESSSTYNFITSPRFKLFPTGMYMRYYNIYGENILIDTDDYVLNEYDGYSNINKNYSGDITMYNENNSISIPDILKKNVIYNISYIPNGIKGKHLPIDTHFNPNALYESGIEYYDPRYAMNPGTGNTARLKIILRRNTERYKSLTPVLDSYILKLYAKDIK